MGYRVVYGPEREKTSRPRGKWPFMLLVSGFFVLFCGFAQHFYWEELTLLYQLVLPREAMEELVGQIKEGENVMQAVAAFCEDVLHGR